ncbi:MAG TPA: hypothetical protein VGK58_23555, partial [Lacipirellulaceae bacterium]
MGCGLATTFAWATTGIGSDEVRQPPVAISSALGKLAGSPGRAIDQSLSRMLAVARAGMLIAPSTESGPAAGSFATLSFNPAPADDANRPG